MSKQNHKHPDFVIAGVARSGTGTLYTFLDKQQNFFMAQPQAPEPKFFCRENIYSKGVDWYLNTYFNNCEQHLIAGEKSTEYFESLLFPERAIKHFPKLKVIVILRDPVERTISNYWWSVKNDFEKRSINDAIENEIKERIILNKKINEVKPYDYISRSLYAQRLENLFNFFPSQQVLLLDFERDIINFKKSVNKIEDFFDIKLTDYNTDIKINEAARPQVVSKEVYKMLKDVFYTDVQEVNKKYKFQLKNGGELL